VEVAARAVRRTVGHLGDDPHAAPERGFVERRVAEREPRPAAAGQAVRRTGGPDHLLHRDSRLTAFELVDTTSLANGIVILSYRVAR
jgi:hypothetical protein